jgi:XXXCH domain-containing protein
MEEQIEGNVTREALAEVLEKWAMQLRSGQVAAGGQAQQIPDDLEVKIQVRQKKGEARCKLEWRWPLLTDASEPAQHEALRRETQFKRVKKDLAVSFKQLKRSVPQGISSNDPALQQFVENSRALVALAEPEWQQAAQEYLGHLENLLRAVRLGEQSSVLHEIEDLEQRMVACHREFR